MILEENFPLRERYTQLARNISIFALGTLGSRSIAFFMLPLYTKLLSARDYGVLDVFQTTINLLVPVLSLELGNAVFRFTMDNKENKSHVLSTALLVSPLPFLSFLSFHTLLRHNSMLDPYLSYFYVICFLTIFLGEMKQYVRGIGAVKMFALSDILQVLVLAGTNLILMVVLSMGLRGYFLSTIFAQAFSLTFLILATGAWKAISLSHFNRRLAWKMFSYALPLIPNALMWWVMNVSDRYLIAYFLNLEANGLYGVACRFPVLLSTVTGIFFPAWQMSAVKEFQAEDREGYYSRVFSAYTSALFILAGILLLFLKELTRVFVDSGFGEVWQFVPFLLIGTIFFSLASFLGTIYLASKNTLGAFFTTALGGSVNFLLNLLFIPLWGVQAAGFTTMLGFMVVWEARFHHVRKICSFSIDKRKIIASTALLIGESGILFLSIPYLLRFSLALGTVLVLTTLHRKNLGQLLAFFFWVTREHQKRRPSVCF